MIPILYEKTETAFASNGLGRLVDCVSCIVTEERNGVYTCEFEYPITGALYSEILEGRIIAVTHDNTGDIQPFDIVRRSAPMDGIVSFYAEHISYRLSTVICSPFTASNCEQALANLTTYAVGDGVGDFRFYTDKSVAADMTVTIPQSVKALLGGVEGSILDTYGTGEYLFDRFSVWFFLARGEDKGVQIRYGKNLSDLTQELDYTECYNGIVPYWKGTDADGHDLVVTLPEWVVYGTAQTYDGRNRVVSYDMTSMFQNAPTVAELRAAATAQVTSLAAWLPTENLKVDFVLLWQTEEYEAYAPLQTVGLCDTVTVIYPELGITGTAAKVIRVVYNTLLDRYDSMELGDALPTFGDLIKSYTAQEITEIKGQIADIDRRIAGDNNQYFWHTETGTDTGSHITEVTQDEFEADPLHGGANLLARSNGVAVRDGLDELAEFSASLARIGSYTGQHAEVATDEFRLKDADLETTFAVTADKLASPTVSIEDIWLNGQFSTADPPTEYTLPIAPKSGTTITLSCGVYTPGPDGENTTPAVRFTLEFTAGASSTDSGSFVDYTTYTGTAVYDGGRTFALSINASHTAGTVCIFTASYTLVTQYLPQMDVGGKLKVETALASYGIDSTVTVEDGRLKINPLVVNDPTSTDVVPPEDALYVSGRDVFKPKILWQDNGMYMTGSHTATLSENISAQPHGVLLMWVRYNNGTLEAENNAFEFIPRLRWSVEDRGFFPWDGEEVSWSMPNTAFGNSVRAKWLYVHDDHITGHNANTASGSGYNNNYAVLVAVFGI